MVLLNAAAESSDASGAVAWLDFVTSLVSSLAWPLVVLTIVLIFRKRIGSVVDALLSRANEMSHVKFGSAEFHWSNEKLESVADPSKKDNGTRATQSEEVSDLDPAMRIARISPAMGVVYAFRRVEAEVEKYLDPDSELTLKGRRYDPLIRFEKSPAVPRDLTQRLRTLRELRNAAAHGDADQVSFEAAVSYIDTASFVVDEIAALPGGAGSRLF